jgi:twinkle protein
MSLYEFNPIDLDKFKNAISLSYRDVRQRGDELQLRECPYCHSQHDPWTFAINCRTGTFNCKRASCSVKGNMITLAKDFGFSLGRDVDEYEHIGTWRKFKTFKEPKKQIESKDPAIEYMKTRGISEEVAKKYEITSKEGQDNVIVFPFRDTDGTLTFIKYRNSTFVKGEGSKEWCEADTRPILFGMNHCSDNGTLVMTEGQIDSLSLAEAGIENAVSVPTGKNGFTWVPYCWDFLAKFDELIVFGDREGENITLLDPMTKRFHGTVKFVPPEAYHGYKDANDLLRAEGPEAVRAAVEAATPVPDDFIKELKDIALNEADNEPVFQTGVRKLDAMTGGMYPGQLVILTGERGRGKSTFASQLVVNAVAGGVKCFIYSGEMPNASVKEWIERQIAGPECINLEVLPSGYEKTHINAMYLDYISAWHEGMIYIYDTDALINTEDEGVEKDLLGKVRKAIVQYGCRFIVIDNLMTALDDNLQFDIYRQQAVFVKKLKRLASRFGVVILLIAHPKKAAKDSKGFENDDVLGSSNITNFADIILRYDVPSKKAQDADKRILELTKGRRDGRKGKIDMMYEFKSKRISDSELGINATLLAAVDFEQADSDADIPF